VEDIFSHCGEVKISVVVSVRLGKTQEFWHTEPNFTGHWDDFFKTHKAWKNWGEWDLQ
jgi:hypothetical protein